MELILPSLYTSTLGVLTVVLAFYFLFLRSNSSKKPSSPPMAGGSWPIIGHLHLLGGSQPPHVTLGNLADKHGPMFTIKLGQYRAIILSKWDLAKECFTAHDLQLLTRPESLVADQMSYNFAMFGFSPYGPYWREIRKMVSIEMLSARRLELLKNSRISEIGISSKELYIFCSKKSSSSEQAVIEMKEWFQKLLLNVILQMIAGKRYFVDGVGGAEDKEANRVRGVMTKYLHFVGLFLPADSIPILKLFDFGGYKKKMKEIGGEMDKLVGGWLKEHRQNRKSGKISDGHDFIDVMISMLEGADIDAPYDPDTIIKSTCVNLIAGASDTTSVTLTWALSRVMSKPETLRKIKEELDLHVGKDRRVTDADIPNLVYLQAVVKETLRLYPPGALGGPRKLAKDTTIGGYHVAKGTRVIFNLWKLHRDPNVWMDDPTGFIPERFLTTHKEFDVKGHNYELLPFGAGRRICPGMHFALQLLHVILGNLFHAFDMETPGGRKIDLKESAGLTNHLVGPLDLVLTPRLPAHLY